MEIPDTVRLVRRRLSVGESEALHEALKATANILGYTPAELRAFREVHVAEAFDNALAGVCLIKDLAAGWTEIAALFVFPAHRGRGVGGRLFASVLADAQDRKRHVYVLSRAPEVIRWMERAGMVLHRNPLRDPWPVGWDAIRHYASVYRLREAIRKAPLRRGDGCRFVAGTLTAPP